jgi:hypothetical protein
MAKHISESLLSTRLLREAQWAGKDGYPSSPQYVTELEGLLAFIQAHNRLDLFWPKLTAPRTQQRDDALQELRVARLLTSSGFPISEWEPAGSANFIGEFSVEVPQSPPIFVEVKSPGWEGQLSQEQRDAGRAKQEKYQGMEGGADDPWRAIRRSVRKAYPKFTANHSNLLVIADDRFMPLATWGDLPAEQALYHSGMTLDGESGYFTTKDFENLGGVALFNAEIEMAETETKANGPDPSEQLILLSERPLRYEFLLYPNLAARKQTALPSEFVRTFLKTS